MSFGNGQVYDQDETGQVEDMVDVQGFQYVDSEVMCEYRPETTRPYVFDPSARVRAVSAKTNATAKTAPKFLFKKFGHFSSRSLSPPMERRRSYDDKLEKRQTCRRMNCNGTSNPFGSIAFAGGPARLLKDMLATEGQHSLGLAGPDIEASSDEQPEVHMFPSLPSNNSQQQFSDAVKAVTMVTPTIPSLPRTGRPNGLNRQRYCTA